MMNNYKSLLSLPLFGLALFSADANAAKYVFPYNHPDLDWFTLETENFAFHYPKSKDPNSKHYLTAEYSARRFATVAEENYQSMCDEFKYDLKEKVHVLVVNQADELAGFTIPSWDWIVMSANPGGGMFSYSRGRMEWFSTVFAHEFAHVVSLKAYGTIAEPTFVTALGGLYENGINRGSPGVSLNHTAIGVEVPLGESDSVWWVEGGAEFWSASTNVNWWTSARDRTIRTSVLEDRLLTYDEWHTRMGKRQTGWNEGERYYQGGHSFALYIRERFGPRAFADFATTYGQGWRPNFESVVKDVTGEDPRTLYNDWKAQITQKYNAQYDRVKAEGEVVGREMLNYRPNWSYTSPSGRDKWLGDKEGLKDRGWFGRKSQREREQEKEATGRYQFEPRVSPDGKYIGWLNRGNIAVKRYDRDQVRAFTNLSPKDSERNESRNLDSFAIPYGQFDQGWDFVPGKDAIVLTGQEDNHPKGAISEVTGITLETDGYNWNQLYYFDYPTPVEEKEGNRTLKRRHATQGFLAKKMWKGEWKKIQNTARASDPAISPDGTTIAHLVYTDGTMNLATIRIDKPDADGNVGHDRKILSGNWGGENKVGYADGTWMRGVDWSPDGKQLVFTMFRNFQQNLYIVNADGTGLQPIMMDEWEQQDAHWAKDGKIYFSADPNGIANVFSYDPKTKEFLQITNVINGAYAPQITKDGDLVYLYYTAHGYKIFGLPKNQFMNKLATEYFDSEFSQAHVDSYVKETLDYSHFEKATKPYNLLKAMSSPVIIPMYRLENESQTNWGIQGGIQFQIMDYAQKNQFFAVGLLGEDSLLQMGYTNDMWYPELFLYGGLYQGKYDQGYLMDSDGDPDTTDDLKIYEIKRSVQQFFGGGSMSYVWNGRFNTSLYTNGWHLAIQGTNDQGYEPILWAASAGFSAQWSNNAWMARSPNPYYGRTVMFDLSHTQTDNVYEAQGGVTIDDGQELDRYGYNRVELRWSEILPIPSFGSKVLKEARKRRHVIQLDGHVGYVDRNVGMNHEFRAGGRHPYFMGLRDVQTNVQFAGFPRMSLSGETLAIFNAAYRFPITRPEQNWLMGPIYFYGLYGQFGATAGNLWSYKPPSDPSKFYRSRYNDRVAYDENDIKREIPFVDVAYKNGNRMLYDMSFELRATAGMFHTMPWNSFIRLAYGFNEIRGYGDVDGDDLFDTSDSVIGDELSNEVEPAGFRFYLGLGTGW